MTVSKFGICKTLNSAVFAILLTRLFEKIGRLFEIFYIVSEKKTFK